MAEEFRIAIRWSVVAGLIGAIVLFAQLVGALQAFEPWAPATHGWVRTWAEPIIQERNDKIKLVQDEHNARFNILTIQQYTLQILVLDSLLTNLNSELIDLEFRLRDDPNDRLALNRKHMVLNRIKQAQNDMRIAECGLRPNNPAC